MADNKRLQVEGSESGATTPEQPKTPGTYSTNAPRVRRSDSQETLVTSYTEHDAQSVYSDQSRTYPQPPLNSPLTLSEIGEANDLNASTLADKLANTTIHFADVTPPTSTSGGRTERRESRTREETPTPTKKGDKTPPSKVFPEHSIWADLAEEDVEKGLMRLIMLAKDEHKENSSKTVDQYYSERLAKLIKNAEVEFDDRKLHKKKAEVESDNGKLH